MSDMGIKIVNQLFLPKVKNVYCYHTYGGKYCGLPRSKAGNICFRLIARRYQTLELSREPKSTKPQENRGF
jgi:hypothetical protein